MSDDGVLMERDASTGIARRMLNNPERRNTYDPPMRDQVGAYLDELASDDKVEARASWWARKIARMPADGIVMAKEAFRLVEQLQGYQGEEVASYLFHAFGTNLQFDDGEFNFVKTRAEHGAKKAFELCKAHFDVPEPGAGEVGRGTGSK